MDRLTLVLENLKALGGRKLAALGLIFALVVAIVAVAAYLLSRPTFEVLYAGLDREDTPLVSASLIVWMNSFCCVTRVCVAPISAA
jgi:flagellar M-ring protein FliF